MWDCSRYSKLLGWCFIASLYYCRDTKAAIVRFFLDSIWALSTARPKYLVSYENCNHLLLQVQTGWDFVVVANFSTYSSSRPVTMMTTSPSLVLSKPVNKNVLFSCLSLQLVSITKWGEIYWLIQYHCRQLRATQIIFGNTSMFGNIGLWVTFSTTHPSRLGFLLRDSTISSSSCRPIRSFGLWVIFYPSSPPE